MLVILVFFKVFSVKSVAGFKLLFRIASSDTSDNDPEVSIAQSAQLRPGSPEEISKLKE